MVYKFVGNWNYRESKERRICEKSIKFLMVLYLYDDFVSFYDFVEWSLVVEVVFYELVSDFVVFSLENVYVFFDIFFVFYVLVEVCGCSVFEVWECSWV